MTLDWVIGFYEGEGGCWLVSDNGGPYRLRVNITQKEEEILIRIKTFLQEKYGISSSISPGETAARVCIYRQKDVFAFLDLIRPRIQSQKKGAQIDAAVRQYVLDRKFSPQRRIIPIREEEKVI